MYEFTDIINIDDELKNKVSDLARKDKVKIISLAEKCKSRGLNSLRRCDDVCRLAVVLELLPSVKEKYDKLGINDDIFADTMNDISIWCANNGNKGLRNIGWIENHISLELFKLGRLQFQMSQINDHRLRYSYLPISRGDNVIKIHIPQGEKLLYSECVASIRLAVNFFDTYFPEFHYDYFVCESWLLYKENCLFMDMSSNILQFASLFDVVYSAPRDKQAIERIFGKRMFNKKNYEQKTTLQKNAKAFMQQGGKLGEGTGIISKSDYKD